MTTRGKCSPGKVISSCMPAVDLSSPAQLQLLRQITPQTFQCWTWLRRFKDSLNWEPLHRQPRHMFHPTTRARTRAHSMVQSSVKSRRKNSILIVASATIGAARAWPGGGISCRTIKFDKLWEARAGSSKSVHLTSPSPPVYKPSSGTQAYIYFIEHRRVGDDPRIV